ncbi:conjugal transfer protein TrbC [Escherichia coli]|nr:conjugal transfer protein TrbC [Escherichia coli]EEZ8934454.1 conjugal transfer protein TrbC [Escherichia coli]EFA2497455.1 conjugal transfer protein TrbC [Escherichia coli]EKR2538946.1 conjugal transfer protein TrbC [Escherichia coli]
MSVKLRLPHPQYDTDIESRANELWKKAVHTINNTTREERRVCYITLNRPEEEHSDPEDIPSVKAILNTLLPLEILLPVAENNKSQTINNDHLQKSCGAQPTTDEKY